MLKKWTFIPELYLVVLLVLGAYTPPFSWNPLLVLLAVVILLQLIYKRKTTGIILASLFFVGNLYFLWALLSEFNEFSVLDSSAIRLISVGGSVFLVNLIMIVWMHYKYIYKISSLRKSLN